MPEENYQNVRAVIEQLAPVPDAEWVRITPDISVRQVGKGDFLIREGDHIDALYFVQSGVFRVFYGHDGNEVNRSFVTPGRMFTNSLSFQTGDRSHYWVEALSDATLYSISKEAILRGYETHPCWERIGRLSAEYRLQDKERREQRFRSMTPEEHYFWMVENEQDVVRGVPLYHIASYLRIRPETLSRIRSKSPPARTL
jgi:CRP-like cAMP-binding protein